MIVTALKRSLEQNILLKCQLLIEGCNIDNNITFPQGIHLQKTHLYSHSSQTFKETIPGDILFGEEENRVICRIRYNTASPFKIVSFDDNFFIQNEELELHIPITFIPEIKCGGENVQGHILSTVCTLLGDDLLGVIPSNYCFYFKDNKQCRFCEIFQTFQKEVEYQRPLKKIPIICEAISKALALEPRFKHLAVTTGNISSYDYTFEYMISIGKQLLEVLPYAPQQSLATLMPPDSPHLMEKLGQTIFNKVDFPIEVFEYSHFLTVCPGKGEFGYQKIIDGLVQAKEVFGVGNSYTNLVYGIQSLNSDLDPKSYDAQKENEKSLIAVESFLKLGIIPGFTLYHFGGYNQIGSIPLDSQKTFEFFKEWGEMVYLSKLVKQEEDSVLFSPLTLSNTLYNDTFRLAKQQAGV